MKFSFPRERMLAAFQTAAMVVPSRSPKSILKNVRIDAQENRAIISATDLEVGIRIEVRDVQVETPGSFLTPVSLFGSILRESSDTTLRINMQDSGIVVRGDRSEFKLPYQNPDEFPQVAEFSESQYHELSGRVFRELVRRTTFATEQDNTRYALGGVLLEFEPERIVAVATDGRRLAKMEGAGTAIDNPTTANATTIVPTRAMQLMERAFGDSEGNVRIATRANDVFVQGEESTIFARLVEGRFPRWRDVLPKRTNASRIDLIAGPFLAALRQVAIFTSNESRRIDFRFADGSLVMQASTAETGQSRVDIPIAYTGQPITIALDNRYLLDFLRVLGPQQPVVVDVEDSESAALFETSDGYAYVVMPMARDEDER